MDNASDRRSDAAKGARPPHGEALASQAKPASPAQAQTGGPPPAPVKPRSHLLRNVLLVGGVLVGLTVAAWLLVPWIMTALNTVSTDDAYVNGHVTTVAPGSRAR